MIEYQTILRDVSFDPILDPGHQGLHKVNLTQLLSKRLGRYLEMTLPVKGK